MSSYVCPHDEDYLYVHDDIAWIVATFEEHAADVLETLPS
jgi:hypothetical protein